MDWGTFYFINMSNVPVIWETKKIMRLLIVLKRSYEQGECRFEGSTQNGSLTIKGIYGKLFENFNSLEPKYEQQREVTAIDPAIGLV